MAPVTTNLQNYTEQSYLRVVLFTSDRASHFRPHKDDSQWFHRRDALVRCVASFLYGPATAASDVKATTAHRQRELVILFDEDWTTVYMTLLDESDASSSADGNHVMCPTEQHIMSLWKLASERPGEIVVKNGLSCRFVVDVSSKTSSSSPTGMDNKREILAYLQANCDLDFLRQHHLNSSAAVVLKKTNKKALLTVCEEWLRAKGEAVTRSRQDDGNILQGIMEDLLQPVSTDIRRVIAGTLHETSELELPYWKKKSLGVNDGAHTQICLFLGAVRDMSDAENATLRRVCDKLFVPYTGIRIGPVAEFTSKILTVVAYHHAHGRLDSAVESLVEKKCAPNASKQAHSVSQGAPVSLDVICLVPMKSSSLDLDLEKRDLMTWKLVRCTVVTLWRSRLAGGSCPTRESLTNRLTILFDDGINVTLTSSDVQAMAESHQAAPCEHQIIKLILRRIDESICKPSAKLELKESKEVALALVRTMQDKLASGSVYALDLTTKKYGNEDGCAALADWCYCRESFSTTGDGSVEGCSCIVLLSLSQEADKFCWEQAFLRAFYKLKIHVADFKLQCMPFIDQVGASVTLLQHFCYQKQLTLMIKENQTRYETKKGKKRKPGRAVDEE